MNFADQAINAAQVARIHGLEEQGKEFLRRIDQLEERLAALEAKKHRGRED